MNYPRRRSSSSLDLIPVFFSSPAQNKQNLDIRNDSIIPFEDLEDPQMIKIHPINKQHLISSKGFSQDSGCDIAPHKHAGRGYCYTSSFPSGYFSGLVSFVLFVLGRVLCCDPPAHEPKSISQGFIETSIP